MEEVLLTTDELATRWKVKRGWVDEKRKEGLLPVCEGLLPTIRFRLEDILKLEGAKIDKLSPLERKRLERENNALREENKELKAIITRTFAEIASAASTLKY